VIEEFLALVMMFLVVILILTVVQKRRSLKYRKEIMDFYVAAKTRTLAKADNLDLDKEELSFKSWLKKEKSREKEHDLDDTIEEELKERVSETIVKKK